MGSGADHGAMTLVVIAFIFAVGPLAVLFGADSRRPFDRRSPAAVVAALATVYLVWGSTYLAIRVTDRTMPPLLMSSVRFRIAGTALYAFASRGRARPTRREWLAAAIVGAALLLVGNGGVAWAETRLDSRLAALIVAIIPLWVAVLDRFVFGRRL